MKFDLFRRFCGTLVVLLAVAAVEISALAEGSAPVGTYEVSLAGDDIETIDVAAHFTRTSGRIFTGIGGGDYLDGGWPSVIENLVVSTPDGQSVRLDPGVDPTYGAPFWALSLDGSPYGGPIELSYSVNLDYARSQHPYGNEQGGQMFENALYTVARPIFIASDVDGQWRVRFDLPVEMSVSYPVPRFPGDPLSFEAGNFLVLQDNPLTIGRYFSTQISVGTGELDLVLPHLGRESPEAIGSAANAIMALYSGMLPDADGGDYQLVLFPSYADDGESYMNGAVVTTSGDFAPANQLVWSGLVAHEVFHYWNGVRLAGANPSATQWFSEGVTEYYAVLAQVNLGLIDEDQFRQRLAHNIANYLYFLRSPAFDGLTLQSAGENKSRNRPGVYSGGFAVAFALDLDIYTRTGGERSLNDVMRVLYESLAMQGEPYSLEDIANAARSVTGHDYWEFLNAHIVGDVPVDVAAPLNALGFTVSILDFAGEAYLTQRPVVSEAERERWHWLTRAHFE